MTGSAEARCLINNITVFIADDSLIIRERLVEILDEAASPPFFDTNVHVGIQRCYLAGINLFAQVGEEAECPGRSRFKTWHNVVDKQGVSP